MDGPSGWWDSSNDVTELQRPSLMAPSLKLALPSGFQKVPGAPPRGSTLGQWLGLPLASPQPPLVHSPPRRTGNRSCDGLVHHRGLRYDTHQPRNEEQVREPKKRQCPRSRGGLAWLLKGRSFP